MEPPGTPPSGHDPNVTQPLPRVRPAAPPSAARTGAARPAATFVPRYGNLGTYLLARLAAFAIDVVGIAFLAAAFTFGQLRYDPRIHAIAGGPNFAFVALASLGGALVFAMLCEGVIGTTLGKALFALHVHRARGGYAGLGRALVRALLRPVDLLLVGPALAAVTPKHQRLGDLAAGTTVARSPAGFVAPLIAVLLLGGLGYAEVLYGGGLDSAVNVSAETANDLPAWRANLAPLLGVIPGFGGAGAPVPGGLAGATASPAASLPAATTETPSATPETPSAKAGTPPAFGETPDPGAETPGATFPPGGEATPAASESAPSENAPATPASAATAAAPV